jgi:GT2 family glycosyltransferase
MNLHRVLCQHKNGYKLATDTESDHAKLTVSFVVPVYNSALTIADCVQTIVNQQRADLIKEIILVNDGSTDASMTELKRLAAQYPQQIIILDNDTRKYAAFTRNRGIERSTGDLVCFIDSDILLPRDYMHSHIMQHQADDKCITFSLRSNVPAAELAAFPIKSIDGDFRSELLGDRKPLQGVDFVFCDTHSLAELCLTCAVTYRRKDLLTVKGCPENFRGWGFNDTAMAAKVISLGRSVVPLYDVTVAHIEHAPRSGGNSKKWSEFAKNKHRYKLMLDLPVEDTFSYRVEALDI